MKVIVDTLLLYRSFLVVILHLTSATSYNITHPFIG